MTEVKRERKPMTIPAGDGGKKIDVKFPDSGTYVARLIGLYAIGNQPNNFFGKANPDGSVNNNQFKDTLILEFELSTELAERWEGDGEVPFTAIVEYTKVITDKSKLYKDLKSWNPKVFETVEKAVKFNLYDLIGKACMINVETKTSGKGNEFLKVNSISPVMKGVVVPDLISETRILDVLDYTEEELENAPKSIGWVVDKFKGSNEYKTAHSETQPAVQGTGVNPSDNDLTAAVEEAW